MEGMLTPYIYWLPSRGSDPSSRQLPDEGRAAGVGVDLVKVCARAVAGIAQVEVAIGVKTDVLPQVAAVRTAKITNIRCLPVVGSMV